MTDTRFAREAWLRALQATAPLAARGETLPQLVDRWALSYDSAPALLGTDGTLTYRRLAWRVNQFSRWGISRGLRRGDTVALLMGNAPDYLAIWIGLIRLGVSVALINPQQMGEVLANSIDIVKPKFTITDAQHALRLAAIRLKLTQPETFVLSEAGEHAESMEPELRTVSGAPLAPQEAAWPALRDNALYIYTSGTTGMPKAARVSHFRLLQWSHWFAGLLGVTPQDRMYNCLPLCHSVGGVVAALAPLVNGGSVVIRPRFSASDFWPDVRASGCTLFQYIGELCRYLVNSPAQPGETEHSLRIACGNGLRAEVWSGFQRRFRVPRIVEYYASTEGNFSLYNCEGEVGAIGRIPAFLAAGQGVELVRHDLETGEPRRSAAGLCERCAVDEPGEALGRIADGSFEGYTDTAASERKVLHDVLTPGDRWYRSGDLMRRDARGFFYFLDRVGDTYRWKGENVSTTEVMSQLAGIRGVLQGVIYGVSMPGNEGRVGMAALAVGPDFDLADAHAEVRTRLASFARPLFLRLVTDLETTATFKPRKHDLVAEGFDPLRIKDPLYFDDPHTARYVPVDEALFAALADGKIRV